MNTNKSHVERPVQLLYSLELFCDIEEAVQEGGLETLNNEAPKFRPKRRAAEIARETVRETFSHENKELGDDYLSAYVWTLFGSKRERMSET